MLLAIKILIFAAVLPVNDPHALETKAKAAQEAKLGIPSCDEKLFESRNVPENNRACRINFLAHEILAWTRWDLASFRDTSQANRTYADVQDLLAQLKRLDVNLAISANDWIVAWHDRLIVQYKAAEEQRRRDDACEKDDDCREARAVKILTSSLCQALGDLDALDHDISEIRHDAKITGVFDPYELHNLGQERRLTVLQIVNLRADYFATSGTQFSEKQCHN